MYDRIIFLASVVALVSSAAFGIGFICCRRLEKEKRRGLRKAIHKRDLLVQELLHPCVGKEPVGRPDEPARVQTEGTDQRKNIHR